MRKYAFIFVLFLVCGVSSVSAKEYKEAFDGEDLYLVFAKETQSNSINEYIPKGQSLDSWEKMLALHLYKRQEVGPKDWARGVALLLKKTNPNAQFRLQYNEEKDEALIDFLTWPTGQEEVEFMEFNIFKITRGARPKELRALQYAVRYYGDDLNDGLVQKLKTNRKKWLFIVAERDFPDYVYEKELSN